MVGKEKISKGFFFSVIFDWIGAGLGIMRRVTGSTCFFLIVCVSTQLVPTTEVVTPLTP